MYLLVFTVMGIAYITCKQANMTIPFIIYEAVTDSSPFNKHRILISTIHYGGMISLYMILVILTLPFET